MGRSMALVRPDQEPPDATFDHPPSRRRYQVRRKGGRLWHRELLLTDGPGEVLLAEYPLLHVVGSGRHSRTYTAEADGFLVESPVTWYTSKRAWGMSPGYDSPRQVGFERDVGQGCLICHAGRSEALGRSLHRMRVTEPAIGCERCHGPGSLHVAAHEGKTPTKERPKEAADYTIVNPRRLPRELAEAVCQQCHLRASATVVARGRKPADFRPGLPLVDYRQDYALESPDGGMTVTGHVEQMHLSKCYRKSDTLSCTTCHSPHDEPEPKDKVAYYRAACLGCHAAQSCKVDPARLKRESPENSCIACHMPSSPTDIPHLAFTHHRIGFHAKGQAKPAAKEGGRAVLREFLAGSRLTAIDRERSLGLGYLEATNREKSPARAAEFQQEALRLLSGVRKAGLRDGAVEVALARIHFDREQFGETLDLARRALELDDLDGQDRCVALALRAASSARQHLYAEAAAALRELVTLRWAGRDWQFLAECEMERGNQAGGIEALKQAARISPRQWQIHEYLAGHYRRLGDRERARYHKARAVP